MPILKLISKVNKKVEKEDVLLGNSDVKCNTHKAPK